MLHAAGVEFKDTRFSFKEWPEIKPTTPLGTSPVLKIDGVQHVQSISLARYAAKLAGFYPEDPVQALICDEVMESLNEMLAGIPKAGDKDAEEVKKLREEYLTKYAKLMEGFIQNNGGGATICSGGVTAADILLSGNLKMFAGGMFDHVTLAFFDAYPGILAAAKAAEENEKVKAYYASKA